MSETEKLIDTENGTPSIDEMKNKATEEHIKKESKLFVKAFKYIRRYSFLNLIFATSIMILCAILIIVLSVSGDVPNITYGSVFYALFALATSAGVYISLIAAGKEDLQNSKRNVPIKILITITIGISIVANIFLILGYLPKIAYSTIQCFQVSYGSLQISGINPGILPWADSTAVCRNNAPDAFSLDIAIFVLIVSIGIIVLHTIMCVYLYTIAGVYAAYLIAANRVKIYSKGKEFITNINKAFTKQSLNDETRVEEVDEMEEGLKAAGKMNGKWDKMNERKKTKKMHDTMPGEEGDHSSNDLSIHHYESGNQEHQEKFNRRLKKVMGDIHGNEDHIDEYYLTCDHEVFEKHVQGLMGARGKKEKTPEW